MFTLLLPLAPLIIVGLLANCPKLVKAAYINIPLSLTLTPLLFMNFSTAPMYTSMFFAFDPATVILSSLSFFLSALACYITLLEQKESSQTAAMTLVLLIHTFVFLMFTSSSWLYMYFFFEASLLPTFVIIARYGKSPERFISSFYFVLYTVTASLPLLVCLAYLSWMLGVNSIFSPPPESFIHNPALLSSTSFFLFSLFLCLAFLVKVPLFLVHLWLPKAHVEAPTPGSMLLAGILLKLGVYGLYRVLSITPLFSMFLAPLISPLALWGACLSAIMCFRATDIKVFIAYSSVVHMAPVIATLFSLSPLAPSTSILVSVSHGLASSGLFAFAGIIATAYGTRSTLLLRGCCVFLPATTPIFFLLSASNLGAPPFLSFIGEIFLFMSIFSQSYVYTAMFSIAAFFAGCYSLYFYTLLAHGPSPTWATPAKVPSPALYFISTAHVAPLFMLFFSPEVFFMN